MRATDWNFIVNITILTFFLLNGKNISSVFGDIVTLNRLFKCYVRVLYRKIDVINLFKSQKNSVIYIIIITLEGILFILPALRNKYQYNFYSCV